MSRNNESGFSQTYKLVVGMSYEFLLINFNLFLIYFSIVGGGGVGKSALTIQFIQVFIYFFNRYFYNYFKYLSKIFFCLNFWLTFG
jgi:hypothetical protein